MLELYQFEECPFSRQVRLKMSEWEIDYILRNVSTLKSKRQRLKKVSGQTSVPTLIDSLRKAGYTVTTGIYPSRHLAAGNVRKRRHFLIAPLQDQRFAEAEACSTDLDPDLANSRLGNRNVFNRKHDRIAEFAA